jgi:hypothetical protein
MNTTTDAREALFTGKDDVDEELLGWLKDAYMPG